MSTLLTVVLCLLAACGASMEADNVTTINGTHDQGNATLSSTVPAEANTSTATVTTATPTPTPLTATTTSTTAEDPTVAMPATTVAMPATTTTATTTVPVPLFVGETDARSTTATDFASCTCDLTAQSCDVNCCCDPDCSQEDKAAFSTCYVPPSSSRRLCIYNQFIARENIQGTVEHTSDGLFCVYTDQNDKRNYFEVPRTPANGAAFEQFIQSSSDTYAWGPMVAAPLISAGMGHYVVGDVIWTSTATGEPGVFVQPGPIGGSAACSDNSPVGYLQSGETVCTRNLNNVSATCTQWPALDAKTYFDGFRVMKRPLLGDAAPELVSVELVSVVNDGVECLVTEPVSSTLSSTGSSMAATTGPLATSTMASVVASTTVDATTLASKGTTVENNVSFTPIGTSNTTLTTAPTTTPTSTATIAPTTTIASSTTPTLTTASESASTELSPSTFAPAVCPPAPVLETGSGSCVNVVQRVAYNVTYNSSGIVRITLALQLGPASSAMTQFFKVQFFPTTAVWTSKSLNTYPRSGNPGYLYGRPLLAGNLLGNETEAQVVHLEEDPSRWLSFPGPDLSGRCDPQSRLPVGFGQDMVSGCLLELPLSAFADCVSLRHLILAVLRTDPKPAYLGKYGNARQERVADDWVPVLGRTLPSASTLPGDSATLCSAVYTGVRLEILTAKVGALDNPQHTVVGAQYTYSQSPLEFICSGSFCQPDTINMTQSFELTWTVSFRDVSASPNAEVKPAPELQKLPHNFFYPFL